MASTITAATLTVTLTESISLNGSQQGATNTKTFADINEISKRILTITTNEAVIATFSGAVGSAGHFNDGNVRYMRFTNKDDTNFITLTFRNQDNDEVAIKLDAGQSLYGVVIIALGWKMFLMQLKMLMLLLIQLSEA